MNTRQALRASLDVTPDVLATTIAVQRTQLRDTLHIADMARVQEDMETWATKARQAADIVKALEENLEMQNSMTSLNDLTMFQAGTLVEHARKSYERDDDPTYAPALKKAYAQLIKEEKKAQPKKSGGARVRR